MTTGPLLPPDLAVSADLSIDADLTIEVDTASGEHATGRLTGRGHRLRLEVDRPEVFNGTVDRGAVGALAEQLTRARLHAELHGPRGRLAVVDPARTSRISALVTGSPHVVLDRSGWRLVARTAAPAVAVAAGAATLLTAAALVRRHRSSA